MLVFNLSGPFAQSDIAGSGAVTSQGGGMLPSSASAQTAGFICRRRNRSKHRN